MHSYRVVWLAILSVIIGSTFFFLADSARAQQPQQRSWSKKSTSSAIVACAKTTSSTTFKLARVTRTIRPRSSATCRRSSLGFFDKVGTRVYTEDAPRGGIRVTFEVKELPIIRDIQFEGLKSVSESDVLKTFREKRVGVSKEAIYDPVKVRNAIRVLKEMLAAKGHPNATIAEGKEAVSATSVAITFQVTEGPRVRVAEIEFEGSKVFKSGKLRDQMKYVKEAGIDLAL